MAERVGFEPTLAFAKPVFKTGAINHSTTSPDSFGTIRWTLLPNWRSSSTTQRGFLPGKGGGLFAPVESSLRRWPEISFQFSVFSCLSNCHSPLPHSPTHQSACWVRINKRLFQTAALARERSFRSLVLNNSNFLPGFNTYPQPDSS
jgi:hypothetical protein